MPLDVHDRADRVGVVIAQGEIDIATVGSLLAAVTEQLARGAVDLVLDLSTVTFIDSTGLGVLVAAGKKTRDMGGSACLVSREPRVLRVLAVTGIDKALPVYATTRQALADRSTAD
jgi:anti-anti-sigma factor